MKEDIKKRVIAVASILALLLASVMIRYLYLNQFSGSPLFAMPTGPDVEEYDSWAKQMIAGGLLWNQVHIHAPLYPLFLALQYYIFNFSVPLVRIFQLFILAFSVVPILLALRMIYGKLNLHCLIFAALWLLYPPLIYYGAEITSEALLIPLLCLAIFLIYGAEKRMPSNLSLLYISSAGAFTGLAVITHPSAIFFLLFEILYLFFIKLEKNVKFLRRVSNSLIYAASAALFILPITLYNFYVLDTHIPIQANSGFNFYLGNNPDADGTCYLRPGPEWTSVHQKAKDIAKIAGVSTDRYFISESEYFIDTQPFLWSNLILQKALYAWNYRELVSGADSYPIRYFTSIQRETWWSFALIAILALTCIFSGIGNGRFIKDYRHFLLLLLAFWLVQIIFVTSARYRLTMIPSILVFASLSIDTIMRNHRNFVRGFLPFIGIAAAIVILPSAPFSEKKEKAEADSILGEAFFKTGHSEQAIKHLKASSDANPAWSRNYNLLGFIYQSQGKLETAEAYYLKAVECNDLDSNGLMNLAVLNSDAKRYHKARDFFQKAIGTDRNNPDLNYNYAVYLSNFKGNEILAKRHYWECLRINPAHKKALNNMGVISLREGKADDSIRYFKSALGIEPENPFLMMNLSAAYDAKGDANLANKYRKKAISINPSLAENPKPTDSALNQKVAASPKLEYRGAIRNLQGSYISVVHRGEEYQFFGNIIEKTTPGLTLFTGTTPNAVGPGELIAPNSLIDDLLDSSGQPDPTRMITRPVVRFSDKEQRYYAIIHVARGYPPSNGQVYPAMLVSKTADPRKGWIYKGQFKGEPAALFPSTSWTSGMAFLLNDKPGDVIDHANPLANKFALYNEFGGHGLKLLYSNDGTDWFFYRNIEKKMIDFMPKTFDDDVVWCFSSIAKTPAGYFMYVSSRWTEMGPAGHRFLYSKDGLTWKQIQSSSQGPKNFSLAYDTEKNLIYIMPTVDGNPPYAKDLFVMPPSPFEVEGKR